jgi:hypothetical protein
LRYGKKVKYFLPYPWHTESRSNGANFWLVMRVHTGHHHDPIGYELGLMVTKRAHQVDGWMDGRTDGRHSNHFTTSAFR